MVLSEVAVVSLDVVEFEVVEVVGVEVRRVDHPPTRRPGPHQAARIVVHVGRDPTHGSQARLTLHSSYCEGAQLCF